MTITPKKEIARPYRATFDGLILNMMLETTIAMTGVVLTRTVAFKMLVDLTDETKRTKWEPNRRPSNEILLRLALRAFNLKGIRSEADRIIRRIDATISRPIAIDKAFNAGRSLMKTAADPKKKPAHRPSSMAVLLLEAVANC